MLKVGMTKAVEMEAQAQAEAEAEAEVEVEVERIWSLRQSSVL